MVEISAPMTGTVDARALDSAAAARTQPATATKKHLHALTSLRFFAAGLIVLAHSRTITSGDLFGISDTALFPFAPEQGVSFFFILSGFIMAYVYPTLDRKGTPRFWRSRFARIWPAHLATFLLLFVLLAPPVRAAEYDIHQWPVILANLFLVHSWIPNVKVVGPFNYVTWSLAVEVAFYLAFPLLIRNFRRTWALRLAIAFLVSVGVVLLANADMLTKTGWTAPNLVAVYFPLARGFEFVLGMTTALLWQRFSPKVRLTRLAGTAVEVCTLAVVIFFMTHTIGWSRMLGQQRFIGLGGQLWLYVAGVTCVPFALLIFVMALEQGWIARMLSFPFLVLLGEISYSVYLVHTDFLQFGNTNPQAVVWLSHRQAYIAWWVLTLVTAYLIWSLIEVPCRRCIVERRWRRPVSEATIEQTEPKRIRPSILAPTWRRAAGFALVLLIPVGYVMHVTAAPSPDHLAKTEVGTQFAIDLVGDQPLPQSGQVIIRRDQYAHRSLAVRGWAVEPASRDLAGGVFIVVDGAPVSWADYGLVRSDVATVLQEDAYRRSGFSAAIPPESLTPGQHRVTVRVVSRDRKTYAEAPGFVLSVQ